MKFHNKLNVKNTTNIHMKLLEETYVLHQQCKCIDYQ